MKQRLHSGLAEAILTPATRASGPTGAPSLHQFLRKSFKERWRKYCRALKHCRKKFNEDSVHQLRIETRRMLALLNLLHPFHPACLEAVEPKFKKLFKRSAPLRDTQVQLELVSTELDKFPELTGFRKYLRRREKQLARKFHKKLTAGVKPKLKKAVANLREWLRDWADHVDADSRHTHLLWNRVNTGYERVLRLRKEVRSEAPATIHRLRIAFKAYRYMVEALQPMLPGLTNGQLVEMQAIQTRMGEIQDSEVLLARLEEFQQEEESAEAEYFAAELQRRHARLIRAFLKTRFHGYHLEIVGNGAVGGMRKGG